MSVTRSNKQRYEYKIQMVGYMYEKYICFSLFSFTLATPQNLIALSHPTCVDWQFAGLIRGLSVSLANLLFCKRYTVSVCMESNPQRVCNKMNDKTLQNQSRVPSQEAPSPSQVILFSIESSNLWLESKSSDSSPHLWHYNTSHTGGYGKVLPEINSMHFTFWPRGQSAMAKPNPPGPFTRGTPTSSGCNSVRSGPSG